MENGDHFRQIVRFGVFEADLQTGELRKSGIKVPLQGQPFQVCAILLSHSGELVTREELRQQVWPEDTFVDFDHALNTAITKIRLALGDEADNPRFVQTLPRRGYRFIAPVAKPSSQAVPPVAPKGWFERLTARRLVASTTLLILLSGIGIWRFSRDRAETIGGYLLRPRPQVQPDKLTILPFTTFPGFEIGPSFSPDGNQIVFAWFGYEKEYQFDLYIKQVGQERVVQLTHHPATFLASAWSPDGRFIAFMRYVEADPGASGIYLVSALGGSERKLADITTFGSWEPIAVSWSADGKWLAFAKGSSPAKKADSSPEHFSIHLVNVETTEERILPDPSHDCVNTWDPAFSPDGKYLASVCVLTEGVAKIYVQTPDGKQAREVAGAWSSEGFSGIAWAADSQSSPLRLGPASLARSARRRKTGEASLCPGCGIGGGRAHRE